MIAIKKVQPGAFISRQFPIGDSGVYEGPVVGRATRFLTNCPLDVFGLALTQGVMDRLPEAAYQSVYQTLTHEKAQMVSAHYTQASVVEDEPALMLA